MESKTIFTIGHSTHPFEDFLGMLKAFDIELLADVRHFPGSRKFPHFNSENLAGMLPVSGIGYQHFKSLGGRRKPNPGSENKAWRHTAFRGYADYMETDAFTSAASELENIARQKRTAMMCSEAVWWRCHRSMIADYLKSRGWEVMHIMGPSVSKEHPFTAPARIEAGKLTYRE